MLKPMPKIQSALGLSTESDVSGFMSECIPALLEAACREG